MIPALRLENLSVELSGRVVLRDVSFEVAPGEVVGLLGRNGAGKTSLLRVASGALAPGVGEIWLGGRPLAELSRRDLARAVSVVPQEFQPPFPFRVGEIVLMGRAPHQRLLGLESATDIERASAAMERVGVAHFADRSIFELSSGERQLVVFARALAQDTPLMLLDEPTAFLDLRHRIALLQVVRERAAEGCAALVVSHDLTLAARVCDRLVLLAEGGVAAAGDAAAVLAPAPLSRAFGIESDVMRAPDGRPVVVPRLTNGPSSTANSAESGLPSGDRRQG